MGHFVFDRETAVGRPADASFFARREG